MINNKWILNNLLSKSEIYQIINLIKERASVSNLSELNNYVANKSYDDLQKLSSIITKDELYLNIRDNVFKIIEEKFEVKIKAFPVSGLRIVSFKNETLAPWHQDEGTWSHHAYLSNQNPITCWIPIRANKKNTLQLCLDNIPIKRHDRNDLKQSFAKFNENEIKNSVIIDPIPGSGYFFTSHQPHRSYKIGNNFDLRISIDFRFIMIN